MNKTHLAYFEKDDVLHLAISDGPETGSIEISPNITAEINDDGELIGIEILNASTFIRDSVLESAQARMLGMAKSSKHPLKYGQPAQTMVLREKPEHE